jgi:mono/diheme cytochrome c family protein
MTIARLLLLVWPLWLAQGEVEPHGWSMTVTSLGTEDLLGGTTVRLTPAAAFDLGAGEVLEPRIARGEAVVRFAGSVEIEDAGVYRFGIKQRGFQPLACALTVQDARGRRFAHAEATPEGGWTEPLTLPRGIVRLDAVVSVRDAGAARLQVLWSREQDRFPGFGPEPIPSRFVRSEIAPEHELGLAGRVLLETKGCTSCHAPGTAAHAVGVRKGPDLLRVGARVQPAWLLEWILDPSSYRAHADMPDLFGTSDAERADAEAVVHFLMQIPDPLREAKAAPDPGDARGDGEMLYHTIGCVACHGARLSQAELYDDAYLDASVPSAPLFALERLDEKWRRRELALFLQQPTAVHRDGRMPSFLLSDAEAQALAFALVPRDAPSAFEVDAAQAARGQEVFAARGCGACHSLGADGVGPVTVASTLAPPGLTALRDPRNRPSGCLDPSPDPDAPWTPRYDMAGAELTNLLAGIDAARNAVDAPAPLDELERRIDALGCLRCHALDGRGGRPDELDAYFVTLEDDTDLGDEGRLPPDLSDVGFRLATPWLRQVLLYGGRARPWVATRMPDYGGVTDGMAELFAGRLGVAPDSDAGEPQATDALTLAGRELMGRDKLSCVACHLYKDYPVNGTVGPDMTHFGERLRYEWFAAYMRSPSRYKPGTRMPTFVDPHGRSTAGGVLGGDLHAQIDALWSYFSLGDAMPPPPGVEPARGMPVLVGERPRVMRTFLEDAGSRGIAVGFPVGIHFAYDAEACRLVSAWRGDFLDASGAWAGRGGTVAGGRGPTVWAAPKEWPEKWPLLLNGVRKPEDLVFCLEQLDPLELRHHFDGYRIEPDGTPVLLSTIGSNWAKTYARVEESWSPHAVPEPGFLRRFRIDGLPKDFSVLVYPGPKARLVRLGGAKQAVETPKDGYQILSTGGPVEIDVEVSL